MIVLPSIVLLLLGDAMLMAHTEGMNIAQALGATHAGPGVRIVNTQDILQAALLPGAMLLASWALIIFATAPRLPGTEHAAPRVPLLARERAGGAVVPTVIIGLLALVGIGKVRAVEAAAAAGMLLLTWGLVSRRLRWPVLRRALDDAMALTGALFALLVAATTFSLLMRVLGTGTSSRCGSCKAWPAIRWRPWA